MLSCTSRRDHPADAADARLSHTVALLRCATETGACVRQIVAMRRVRQIRCRVVQLWKVATSVLLLGLMERLMPCILLSVTDTP